MRRTECSRIESKPLILLHQRVHLTRSRRTRSTFPEAISSFSCSKSPLRATRSKSKPPTRVFARTRSRPDVSAARDAATATHGRGRGLDTHADGHHAR
jgi:hypothetical protein